MARFEGRQGSFGPSGTGVARAAALGFGVIVQVVAWRAATHWLWLIGAVAWFIGGFVASEVVLVTWYVTRRGRPQRSTSS